MGQYDDTSDVAYADGGLETLTIAERELFERTITAVGMPPALRHRARRNLLIKFVEGGEDAVRDILEGCLNRAKQVEEWLANNSKAEVSAVPSGLRKP
jgi:hypothetical protein